MKLALQIVSYFAVVIGGLALIGSKGESYTVIGGLLFLGQGVLSLMYINEKE